MINIKSFYILCCCSVERDCWEAAAGRPAGVLPEVWETGGEWGRCHPAQVWSDTSEYDPYLMIMQMIMIMMMMMMMMMMMTPVNMIHI